VPSDIPGLPPSPGPSVPDAPPSTSSPINRRAFIGESGTLLAILALSRPPALHLPARKRYDVLIRNGTVFDGTGSAGVEGDVAIAGARIAAVGRRLGDDAALVIDARGLAVAPGFIDIHSHADGTMFKDPRVESVIRQGVTTVIVGQDGSSHEPSRTDATETRRGAASPGTATGQTIGDFLHQVEALPSSVNVASMVGLGTVRHIVVGDDDRAATEEEMRSMVALVEAALEGGACGASSGLEYIPGMFAPREELIALCRPFASRGLPYATHMRNEDDRVVESVEEAIAIARGAHCPLEISHLKCEGKRNWGKLDTVFARIADARRDGIDVAFDAYPWDAYQTGLVNLFPKWSKDGGTDAFLARLADSATTPKLRAAVLAKIDLLAGWNSVLISSVADSTDRSAEGQRLGAYAASRGIDPYAATTDLLTKSRGSVSMVGFAMSEEDIDRILAHPQCTVCSDGGALAIDGPAHEGHPHPRGLGTFPRILGRYVRERHVLTLPKAIHKMTGQSAARVKLADRGRLAAGMAADVVVFDAATVIERATYADPFQYPEGINVVLVNGQVALREGQRAEHRFGQGLRPARSGAVRTAS
jgi:N-acyl-D-amino-acid deacylase